MTTTAKRTTSDKIHAVFSAGLGPRGRAAAWAVALVGAVRVVFAMECVCCAGHFVVDNTYRAACTRLVDSCAAAMLTQTGFVFRTLKNAQQGSVDVHGEQGQWREILQRRYQAMERGTEKESSRSQVSRDNAIRLQ
jgi:hypothetical protein